MRIGVAGIGKMGAAVAARLIEVGHDVAVWNRTPEKAKAVAGARAADTPAELAERTGTNPRYVTEWLRGQAAGGYVTYQPETGSYGLSEEQAFALADPTGAVYAPLTDLAAATSRRNRVRNTGSAASSWWMTFTATGRPAGE